MRANVDSSKVAIFLANNIQEHLDALERSQAWLAKKAGLTPAGLNRILKVETQNPTLDTIVKISNALECEPAEMILGPDHEIIPRERTEAQIRALEGLSEFLVKSSEKFRSVVPVPENTKTGLAKSRPESVTAIVTALPTLNDSQLNMVLDLVNGLTASSANPDRKGSAG